MRLLTAIFALVLAACVAGTAEDASKADVRAAAKKFHQALKLEKNDPQGAFDLFDQAASLVPSNADYLTAREVARQRLVSRHIQQGNAALASHESGAQTAAESEYRAALALDPTNDFALERLANLFPKLQTIPSAALKLAESSDVIQLQAAPGRFAYEHDGDARQLIEKICAHHKIVVTFDDSFRNQRARVQFDDADFEEALGIAGRLTRSFYVPIDPTHILMVSDTPENHRQFDRMGLRTFYISDASTPQQVNELLSLMRSVFGVRYVTMQADKGILTIRAPQPVLDAATQFLQSLDASRPQVMLNVQVLEVNQSAMRALGLKLPVSYTLFNIPSAALALAASPNIQDLINQLIASGGINQASSQTIAALLGQLQNQQNSLFSTGILTFGHGNTLFGIGIPNAQADYNYSSSQVRNLDQLTLRSSSGNDATFKLGSRFPILNSSYAPIFNSSAISKVIQNLSFQAPFPSISYEDLGLNLKVKPTVHQQLSVETSKRIASDDITLDMDLQIRSLSGQAFNGVPVISNRQYTGSVRLQDGEPAVLVGVLSVGDQRALAGPLGVTQVPGLGRLLSDENKQKNETEVLVIVTPHIIRAIDPGATEQWLPAGQQ
jgi:general secretion pathway protein D